MVSMKKTGYALVAFVLCAVFLLGCSEEKKSQQEKITETVQERMGREAAQELKKPVEEAKRVAAEAGAKTNQALQNVADETRKATQDAGETANKKLEGC